MFGYVTVYKELISDADYSLFRSYYCGLCRAIGSRASHAARMGLSYDITFLAIVLSAVCDDEISSESGGCIVHPFDRREYVLKSRALDYAADVGVILNYLKLLDDWHDEKSIKAFCAIFFLRSAMKRVKRNNSECCRFIEENLKRLSVLEKRNCAEIDECADCFAKILEYLFTPDFVEGDAQKRALSWFGYNIGRWIYVIDAVNDMEKDYKSHSYNPFNAGFKNGDFYEYARGIRREKELTLMFTLENAASAFELLNIKRNKSLINSIIYDCLKERQSQILYTKETAKRAASLPKGH